MKQDVVNATTIYYVPYVGNQISIYSPTGPSAWPGGNVFAKLSLTLNHLPDYGLNLPIYLLSQTLARCKLVTVPHMDKFNYAPGLVLRFLQTASMD